MNKNKVGLLQISTLTDRSGNWPGDRQYIWKMSFLKIRQECRAAHGDRTNLTMANRSATGHPNKKPREMNHEAHLMKGVHSVQPPYHQGYQLLNWKL